MNKYVTLFDEMLNTTTYEPIKKCTKGGYKYPIKYTRETLNTLSNNDNITWKFIYNEICKYSTRKLHSSYLIIWVLYAVELDKKGWLSGSLKGQMALNSEAIISWIQGVHRDNKIFMAQNFNPFSIVLTPRKGPLRSIERHKVFLVEGLTQEQNQFVVQYLSSLSDTLMESRLKRGFVLALRTLVNHDCFYTDFNSYNDKTFFQQFDVIASTIPESQNVGDQSLRCCVLVELFNFYNWILSNLDEKYRVKSFKKITPETLKFAYLANFLLNGYEIVNYSLYEAPPQSDKWILQVQQMDQHKTAEADKITYFDVTSLKNEYLRQWVKECFWFDTSHHIKNRKKEYNILFSFLKPIDDRLAKDESPQITIDDILSFKAKCVGESITDATIGRRLSIVKFFITFVAEKGYTVVDELIYRLLTYHDNKSNGYTEAYTKEEIKQLLEAYKDSYAKCSDPDRQFLYILHYYVIAILSISEMRLSSILSLRTDCLVKTLERDGQDEYKVVVYSKTSGAEPDEYNITRYVKSLIDEVIGLTADLRNDASGIAKDYIFIYRRHNRKTIAIARQDSLSSHHKTVCTDYGIRHMPLGAIRNYYQQQVSEYVTQNGDDPMMIERLSRHGINVHIQHYDAVDIKDFCQRFHQVEIGSIELKGAIQEKNDKPVENTVANGCGHCSLAQCALTGNLDCLMCNHFVATLDCIPQFEKEIELIDEQILNEPLQHEKEFLTNKKRLNVAYLAKLYELEERINANNTSV